MNKENTFAFIVHPRGYGDVLANIKITRFFPKYLVLKILKLIKPFIVSEISGFKSLDAGKELNGLVIAVPLFPKDIVENRVLTRKKIEQAVDLAKKKGAQVVGLGGLLGSVTEGGAGLTKREGTIITAGRAYTAYVVTQYAEDAVRRFGLEKEKTTIAVVGAAGGVGSTVTKILAADKFKKIVLIDLERKLGKIKKKTEETAQHQTKVIITHQMHNVLEADIIITATNAPEAVLKSEDIKTGAIIIDDAQPSDISPEVIESRKDIIIIEAGVITAGNVKTGTNFRLANKDEIYCCLGEVISIAASSWNGNYSAGDISLETINEIAVIADKIGFKLAPYQNFGKTIPPETITGVMKIISERA
ncbi:MAG: hypothetical protein HY452_01215 [Parcubacteria group bacterium]|nr:hypothetical protein [Parcubacteria group bacterium]